jgi:exodeoxyribonuclease VII large subunit
MSDRLYRVVRTLLEMQRHRFERSVGVMRDMRFRVQAHAQHLDELRDGLTRTLTERLTLLHRGWWRQHALLAQGPHNRIQTALVVIPQLYKRLEQEARRGLLSRRQAVASYMMALDALSPLAILSRGYSVIQAIRPGGSSGWRQTWRWGMWCRRGWPRGVCCVSSVRCCRLRCLDLTGGAGNNVLFDE